MEFQQTYANSSYQYQLLDYQDEDGCFRILDIFHNHNTDYFSIQLHGPNCTKIFLGGLIADNLYLVEETAMKAAQRFLETGERDLENDLHSGEKLDEFIV